MLFTQLDKEHKLNLLKLRDYMIETYGVQSESDNFSMKDFSISLDHEESYGPKELPECNTICCLAGHGPAAGILPKKNSIGWGEYIEDSFGIQTTSPTWNFLFSSDWDDDIQEAIERLNMYIEGSSPDIWDYSDCYCS